MAGNSVVIIGGGIAGLSAGCYGQMNGYRTQIFEMHDKPGGLCTSWRRGDYTVDGCIQWLVGSDPASGFRQIWEELGAIQGRTIVGFEQYMRIESRDGAGLTVWADTDRTEAELRKLAPEDRALIDEFVCAVRAFSGITVPIRKAPELRNFLDNARLLPMGLKHGRALAKWGGISVGEFAHGFRNEFLRQAFAMLWYPDFAMSFLLAALGWMDRGLCGYPLGGSLAFSRAIEKRYLTLGGEVHYGRRVKRILVDDDRAVGVELDDESVVRSDCVISAADGRNTIFGLLQGKYGGDEIQGYYDKLAVVPSVVHVAMGVNRQFEEIPSSAMGLNLALEESVEIAGRVLTHLPVHVYSHDPNLAPRGKTLMKTMLISDFGHWEKLLTEPRRYDEAKEEVREKVVSSLDDRFPGLAAQTEMVDIATPVTFNRYTGNWRGSIAGWAISPQKWRLRISRTLRDLDGLYMAGHWVDPIGVPMAALSGRNAVQLMCRRDGKRFGATVP